MNNSNGKLPGGVRGSAVLNGGAFLESTLSREQENDTLVDDLVVAPLTDKENTPGKQIYAFEQATKKRTPLVAAIEQQFGKSTFGTASLPPSRRGTPTKPPKKQGLSATSTPGGRRPSARSSPKSPQRPLAQNKRSTIPKHESSLPDLPTPKVTTRTRWSQRLQELEETANDSTTDTESQESSGEEGQKDTDIRPAYEAYFASLHGSRRDTSNATMSKLPTLDRKKMLECLNSVPEHHTQEKQMLSALYEELFPQWYFELSSGYNLLLYGFGSKRRLIHSFVTSWLNDSPVIVVNGFSPALSAKDLPLRILVDVLGRRVDLGTTQDQLALLEAYFGQSSRKVRDIYVVIHNIDGEALRSERSQGVLTALARIPSIHIVATVDHINAPFLWDSARASQYHWIWHDVTTFAPYTVETSFESSLHGSSGVALGVHGIQYVLRSLTSNAKKAFVVLAEAQLQENSSARKDQGNLDAGLSFAAYYGKCREQFLVSNELMFRTQLTEFRDHQIILVRRGTDGSDYYSIPLEKTQIEELVESMGSL